MTAYFGKKSYNISVSSEDSNKGTVSGGGSYESGKSVTITATPKSGYTFIKWSDNTTANPYTFTVTKDVSLIAYFGKNYNVSVSSEDPNKGTVSGGGIYGSGESATITATPQSGYRFIKWSDNSTANPYTFTVTKDVTLQAHFEKCKHVEIGGLHYNIFEQSKIAEVTYQHYNNGTNYSAVTNVIIPSAVEYNSETYEVHWIGDSAFYRCSSLTSVEIPNSVTSIGEYAFRDCTGLTSVTIPNSVTSIGEGAFHKCTGLTSPVYNAHIFAYMPTSYHGAYSIPDGIESIAGWAFYGCTALTSVTIPNSVTRIENFAFFMCNNLTSVTIPNSVKWIGGTAFYYCNVNTINFIGRIDDWCNKAWHSPGSISSNYQLQFNGVIQKNITIPNSVTSIGNYAFHGCSSLTSVTIPNSVTSIGSRVFDDCTGLTSVTIPNSVTSIGVFAFSGCSSLTSPVYNAHVFAFMPTSYSGAYTIPNGIESIAGGAFFGCTGLTSITIPNSVTSIGNSAFYGCTGLTSVTIPNSVTSIGISAFSGCTGLTSVTIGNSVTSIGNHAFSGCSSLTSVTIPNSVTSIGEFAFNGCKGLTSVTIPNSVTSIGEYAFYGCKGLTSVTIETETPPTCGIYALSSTNDCPIFVPCNAVNAYKAAWSNYANRIRENGNCTSSYTIKFKNWDGSVLQSTQVEEGKMPQYTGTTPTRPDDSQYTYTFSGWTPQIVAATADATYTATFTATEIPSEDCTDVNATWLQTGGGGLGEMTTDYSGVWFYDAQYGAKASKQGGYTGYLMTPAKDLRGMKSVTLSFMHTHKFAGTPSNELTLWVTPNYKGSVETSQWQQLTIAPYAANTNWTFVSVSINVPVSKVGANTVFAFKYMSTASNYATWEIQNLTLIAECEGSTPPQPTYYTIKFKNWDGSVLQSTQVEEGKMPQYTGTTPTKPDDAQYTYTFSGWTPQIVAATADATYTATFAATKLPTEDCTDVNATWLQTGGSGLGEMTTDNSGMWIYDVQYGAVAQANSGETGWLLTPAKDLRGMKSVNLSFLHVHKKAGTFTDDMTLWVCANYKGSVSASQWQQLTIAPYAANNNWTFVSVSINVPLNMVGANTVFGFKYTSSNNSAVWEIKNLTLIAECEGSTPPQQTYYTIKFKNWDGSVLQSKQVEEGKMPQYTGATPTRPDDSQYTYTFSGWTPQIVAATADATYTATFTATEIPSEDCTDVNATWLQTGGSGLGEITTDNSGVWKYEYQYGACAKANSGETGWLLTPAKDLRGMKSVNLSFLHVHKKAGTFTDDMTLWVCANYKGSVSASQWQQLTIAPYAANNNWTFVSVSINVPLNMVGANTVFGFKYISSNSSAKWQIKELNLNAECATDEQGIDNIDSSSLQGGDRGRLILHNGTILILRNGKTYTMQGQEVK